MTSVWALPLLLAGTELLPWQEARQVLDAPGVTQEQRDQALAQLEKCASAGDPRAMVELGYCLLSGKGGEPDGERALIWYQKAADLGDADGCLQAARCHFSGVSGKVDLKKAWHYYQAFETAAPQDVSIAAGEIALFYAKGWEVPRDPAKAFRYYDLARSDFGIVQAGICLLNGIGTERDPIRALAKFRQGIDRNGNPDACFYAALIYYNGDGVPRDLERTFELLKTAADQGHARAALMLAGFYEKGVACQTDPQLARHYRAKGRPVPAK